MSIHNRQGPPDSTGPHEPAHDDDRVAQFFAAERETVRPELANDLDWARIARGARKRGPGRFRNVIVAAAAVAVVAGFGAWTLQQPPASTSSQLAGPAVKSSTATPPGQTQTPQAQGSAANGPQKPAPGLASPPAQTARFTTWSLSNAGSRTVYNLGGSPCGGKICPTLLRSNDSGASWTSVHTFAASSSVSPVTPGAGRIRAGDQLRDVRFVNPSVGYVFGGDLMVTRDGGQTFSQVAHPGQTVLDVEASLGRVLVATAANCTASACSGSVSVTPMDTSANTIPVAASSSAVLTSPISSAQLTVHGRQTVLSLTNATDGSQLPPLRFAANSLQTLTVPAACSGTVLQAVAPAAAEQRRLFALCAPQANGAQTSYTLVTSTDDGSTWSRVSSGKVQLPSGGSPKLAAIDVGHLALAVGTTSGSAGLGSGALTVSSDGGRSFAAKDGPLNLPATGIDWLASPGGRQYYAVTLTSQGYFWSTDAGQTWRLVTPLG